MNKKLITTLIILAAFGLSSKTALSSDMGVSKINIEANETEEALVIDGEIPEDEIEQPETKKMSKLRKFFTRTKKDEVKQAEDVQEEKSFTEEAENAELNEELNKIEITEQSDSPEITEKEKRKNKKNEIADEEPATEVIVDSESLEYFPERHEFEAVGNAKVSFPSENSVLLADKIIFNHDTNYVKGYGNITLIKDGQKINGEYIQVDLNENNAMMTNPVLSHMKIKIRAKEGIVHETQTEALDGIVTFNDKTTYKFMTRPIYGFNNPMMDDVIPKHFYFKEKYDNKWNLRAKTIVIDSYKDRDVATLKNADLYIKNTKFASAGKMKIFTDKEQGYIETNMINLGSMRNIGAFISPGYVFQTPNSSTLKLGPALAYNEEFGVGAMGRFMTDKNVTAFGWTSAKDKIVVRGRQNITDNVQLEYGINSYMKNFFMGSRIPEYGIQLSHMKNNHIEDLDIDFTNRFSGGFYKDLRGNSDYSTTRFTWQTQTTKDLFEYKNEDAKFATKFGINAQTHAALYGTGDTMGVFRVGPYIKTQYRSWQQHLGYFLGGQAGDSPMYFDKNYYGKSSIVLGESLRLCKYLTLMYSTTLVLSDVPQGATNLQENRFYFLIGPDDLKFILGYDAFRHTATMGFSMNLGAENSDIQFKRLVLNEPDSLGKKEKSEKERIREQKRKEAEAKKKQNEDPMNRSVRDYEDYTPDFNAMPGVPGTILQPSMIRPIGM